MNDGRFCTRALALSVVVPPRGHSCRKKTHAGRMDGRAATMMMKTLAVLALRVRFRNSHTQLGVNGTLR